MKKVSILPKSLTRIRLIRFIVQITSFIILNLGIFSLLFGIDLSFILNITKYLILPINQPYGSPFSSASGAIIVIEHTLTSGLFPFFAIGFTIVLALLLGRWFCGWVCPLGVVHHVAGWVGQVMRRARPKVQPHSPGQKTKYYVLVGLLIMALFGVHWVGVFDPMALLYRVTATVLYPATQ